MTVSAEMSCGAPAETEQPIVARLASLALALSADTSRPVGRKVEEIGRLAGHDRAVMGRAWLSLVVPALRGGDPSVLVGERLLAAALEAEGQGEPADLGGRHRVN